MSPLFSSIIEAQFSPLAMPPAKFCRSWWTHIQSGGTTRIDPAHLRVTEDVGVGTCLPWTARRFMCACARRCAVMGGPEAGLRGVHPDTRGAGVADAETSAAAGADVAPGDSHAGSCCNSPKLLRVELRVRSWGNPCPGLCVLVSETWQDRDDVTQLCV